MLTGKSNDHPGQTSEVQCSIEMVFVQRGKTLADPHLRLWTAARSVASTHTGVYSTSHYEIGLDGLVELELVILCAPK